MLALYHSLALLAKHSVCQPGLPVASFHSHSCYACCPHRSSLLDVLPLPEYLQQQAWCRSLLEHLPGGLDHGLLAQAAGVLLTLLAVQLAMGLLISPLQRMCSGRSGVLGVLCWPVTHLVDLPDSVAEVLCSVLLVAAVGRLLLAGAAQLQDVLGLGGAPQQAAAQQGATEARSGAAASAATDSSPVERSADPGSGPATWRSMWTSMTRAGSMRQRSATSATTTPRDRLSNSGRPPKSTSDLSAARSQAASAVTAEHQVRACGCGGFGGAALCAVCPCGVLASMPLPAWPAPTCQLSTRGSIESDAGAYT